MDDDAQHARVDLADGLIDGHDAAGVERGIAFVVVARKKFGFRMHHLDFAAVVIEFDLAEQRDARADGEAVGEISAVEPLGEQRWRRRRR